MTYKEIQRKNYIGQNRRKEEIDLVAQLNQAPTKEDDKRLCLILERHEIWLAQLKTSANQHGTRKRRYWHDQVQMSIRETMCLIRQEVWLVLSKPAPIKRTTKRLCLILERQRRYHWWHQNECQSKREMTKGYALSSKGRKDLSWDKLQEPRKLL